MGGQGWSACCYLVSIKGGRGKQAMLATAKIIYGVCSIYTEVWQWQFAVWQTSWNPSRCLATATSWRKHPVWPSILMFLKTNVLISEFWRTYTWTLLHVARQTQANIFIVSNLCKGKLICRTLDAELMTKVNENQQQKTTKIYYISKKNKWAQFWNFSKNTKVQLHLFID